MSEFSADEWTDITPIPQDDGPNPVVKINYAEEFTRLMDIFRAILVKGEYSRRVLQLTQDLLALNPGSYTVWQYRRACLTALNSDLTEELEYLDSFADENPKNYQIWQHRRLVVEELGDGSGEKSFCDKIFAEDGKNYHAWAHRQWAVKKFQLWDEELDYVNTCLEDDVRNNSAWNYRWFVVHHNPTGLDENLLRQELTYVFDRLSEVAKNESAWNYLRGLYNSHTAQLSGSISAWLEEFIKSSSEHSTNYFAVGLLADISENDGSRQSVEKAIDLFTKLVSIDEMRAKSWTRRILLARNKLQFLS